MDSEEFRREGKALIDMIADYHDTIAQRRVSADVQPGYLRRLIPSEPPEQGEPWRELMHDVERVVLPGMTHWTHPGFFAFFPVGASFPSILGELLSAGLAANGFSWLASPAVTELEQVVLDWVARMVGLPPAFMFEGRGRGGGALQPSASDCLFLALVAARDRALDRLARGRATKPRHTLLGQMVAYCSSEAHSAIEKAAKVALVRLRVLDTDEGGCLRGHSVAQAMEEDEAAGFCPFFCAATLGTTAIGACDALAEVGAACERRGAWFHVDASYAGAALVCPEFRPLLRGIEFAASFNMTPSKWMLVSLECCGLWVRDRFAFAASFCVEPEYLQHEHSSGIDYRHWGISLSRRFRALKLWFTIRSYGVARLQSYIRNHCALAKLFESLVRADDRFQVKNEVWFGLVCFRLVGSNALNKHLLSRINGSGRLFLTQATVRHELLLRFCVDYEFACEAHVMDAWDTIRALATDVLAEDPTFFFE